VYPTERWKTSHTLSHARHDNVNGRLGWSLADKWMVRRRRQQRFFTFKALFIWLKSYGWKYCSLICCERKILFVGWKSTAYKTSEYDLKWKQKGESEEWRWGRTRKTVKRVRDRRIFFCYLILGIFSLSRSSKLSCRRD
jgi:hypothetical protein